MKLNQRIRELMKLRGIENVWQLSKVSGVSASTLDGILNRDARKKGLRIDTLEKICSGLGLTLIEFLSGVKPADVKLAENHEIIEEDFAILVKLYKDRSFMQAVKFIQSLNIETRSVLIKAIEIVKESQPVFTNNDKR